MAKKRKSFDEYKKIKGELSGLRKRRSSLDKKLDDVKGKLAVNLDDEFEVIEDLSKKSNELMKSVNVLAKMIKSDTSLNKRRVQIEREISRIISRTEKLEKIHKDLAEVWR